MSKEVVVQSAGMHTGICTGVVLRGDGMEVSGRRQD